MTSTYPDIDKEFTDLEPKFQEFHDFRKEDGKWAETIRRELDTEIAPELSPVREGLDFQDPVGEKALHDFKAVLTMNPTEVDLHVYGDADEARQKERTLLHTIARGWDMMNFNRTFDAASAEGQAGAGVGFQWLRYHKKTGQEYQKWPHYLEYVMPGNCVFTMPGQNMEPDAFYMKSTTPVFGCDVKRSNGQRPTLDNMGKVGWLGKDEEWDRTLVSGKKFDVIVRDARKLSGKMCDLEGCEHALREISVYVTPEGKGFKEAELVETYDSPYNICSFIITPGYQVLNQSNPHHRFRPMMGPLYYIIGQINLEYSTLMTLARDEADNQWYEFMGRSDPAVIAAMAAEGGPTNVIDVVKPGVNQIARYAGELMRYPRGTSQYHVAILNDLNKMKYEYTPNRFMTGTADTSVANGTGTAYLAALQQAALPFDVPLGNTDASIWRILTACLHAFRFWGKTEPADAQTKWTVVTTGAEHVKKYQKELQAGQQLYIQAKDLECAYDLILKTENLTQAQRDALWLGWSDKYYKGFATPEEVIKHGKLQSDTLTEMEDLYEARLTAKLEPTQDLLIQARLMQKMSLKLGYNPWAAAQQITQMVQGQTMPEGTPSQQVPPQGDRPGSTNALTTPANAAMGRSAQQLNYSVEMNSPGPSGGAIPTSG